MAELSRSDYWKQKFLGSLKRIAFRVGIIVALTVLELLNIFCCVFPFILLEHYAPDTDSAVVAILALLLFISSHLLLLFFLVRPPKKWRNRLLEKDAERWLKERHSTGYRPRPLVRKLVRQAIWIPALLTLLVVLFLPEFLGVWSQRNLQRPVTISGHQINFPKTWILWGQGPTYKGHEYVALLILKGAGTGKIKPWWNWNPPISYFIVESFSEKAHPNIEHDRFLRTITNQGLELQCWQHPLPYQAVRIDCFSANGELNAEFYGSGIYLEDSYRAIEK